MIFCPTKWGEGPLVLRSGKEGNVTFLGWRQRRKRSSGGFTEDSGVDKYQEDNQTQWMRWALALTLVPRSQRAKKEALRSHQTYEGPPKSLRPPKVGTAGSAQKAREEKALLWAGL